MSALNRLKDRLRSTSRTAFQGLSFDLKGIEREREKLEKWLGSAGSDRPARDLMQEALARFCQSLTLETFADARLVCYGCAETVGEQSYRLIEDSKRFPRMLECVDEWRSEPRPFRRCYRGLLASYFSYDPQADETPDAGRKNWGTLQTYLRNRIRSLDGTGVQQDWTLALKEHANLVSEDPCGRYGREALDGRRDAFEEVQRRLGIGEASWVTRRLVLAQIDVAERQVDRQFQVYLPDLLELLRKHPIVQDEGMARLLDRYAACTPPAIYPELRDLSVNLWGNPWLEVNKSRWGRVKAAARAMVADWLKLEIIYQFFNLLSEDGSNDNRRLVFWQRYHKKIDDMYFALGPRAMNSQARDFVALRNKMEGRVLELQAGGSPANNAFMMSIGEYVVVEFGVKGNACFIFRRAERLPFDFSGPLRVDKADWRDESHERLLHKDNILGYPTWEERFEEELHNLTRYRPARNEAIPAAAAPTARTGQSHQVEPWPRPQSGQRRTSPKNELDLNALRGLHKLQIDDRRPKGGNLWVLTDDSDMFVSDQLRAFGFSYKPGKGWWRQ